MAEGKKTSVHVSTVTSVVDGKEEKDEVEDEGTGVKPEIRAWGEALAAGGRANAKQSPEEALADLEIVSIVLMWCGSVCADLLCR